MRKVSLAILAGVMATSAYAGTATNNIQASVTVASTLSVAATQNLDFGTIIQGDTATVSLPGACPSALPGSNGVFTVSGATGGENVTMTMGYDANLVSGANTIALGSPAAGFCATGDDSTAPTTVTTAGTGVTLAADAASTNQVFVGGSVTADPAQAVGTYTGTVTLTVTY